jgi:hypothetical protein
VRSKLETDEVRNLGRPSQIRFAMRNWFEKVWNEERANNRNFAFHNTFKQDFSQEKYISHNLSGSSNKVFARIRTSSHRLNIETGRHGVSRLYPIKRVYMH